MARDKKLKVQIKRHKTSLGWAYRIYIDGTYMGTGLTRASARDGAQRMLVNYERAKPRNQPSKIHGDGSEERERNYECYAEKYHPH